MKLQEPKLRTLDEEITRCHETAGKYRIASEGQDISDLTKKGCQEVAVEQQQLAEWLTELKELKAADVQPVRRGRWEEIEDYDGDVHYRCTNCKTEFYLEVGTPESNEYWYCPHCGADMRGEENA